MRIPLMLLRAGVTAAVMGLVFHQFGTARILAVLRHLDFTWLLGGSLLALAQVFLITWRWQTLCGVLTGAAPPFRALLLALGRSLLLGQFLPATVGADAVRATAVIGSVGASGAVRSVVCDRLVALLALLLLVAAELPFLVRQGIQGAAAESLGFVSLGGIAGFIGFLALRPILGRIPFVGRFAALLSADLGGALRHRRGRLSLLIALLSHGVSAATFVALLRSVDPAAAAGSGALVILPVLLVISVPISLGGWGVREAAVATGFSLLGADPVPALTASLLFGLLTPTSGALVELGSLIAPVNCLIRRRISGSPSTAP